MRSSHAEDCEENDYQYFRCTSRFVKFMTPCLNFGLFDLQAVSGYQIKKEMSTVGIERAECLVKAPSYMRSEMGGLLKKARWAFLSRLMFINRASFHTCFFFFSPLRRKWAHADLWEDLKVVGGTHLNLGLSERRGPVLYRFIS